VLHPLDHQLSDAVAAMQPQPLPRVVIDNDDLDLPTVSRVDGARGIHQADAKAGRQPGPRVDERGESLGQGHRDPGRQHGPFARADLDVDRDHVSARIPGNEYAGSGRSGSSRCTSTWSPQPGTLPSYV
jgi:hypothetical protein